VDKPETILTRELDYHERLYSGFAQQHFAKPAVRALRAHMVSRILRVTGAGPHTRVLSLGCGIGDTEVLLAPHVGEVIGIDLSPAAIRQATDDCSSAGLKNATFLEASLDDIETRQLGAFDLVIAIFFLHHLPDAMLNDAPVRIRGLLNPGAKFYSLDPNRYRLSGALGSLLVPQLMRKYQTPDERQLSPAVMARLFRQSGFECNVEFYDFVSSPLAGLFPDWRLGYSISRLADELPIRIPGLKWLGSNFEIIASKPR
jgi:SAM-dependent methyltransferase